MLCILLLILVFLILFEKNKKGKKQIKISRKGMCEKDKALQRKIAKEIENFLFYDGEEQDDIV